MGQQFSRADLDFKENTIIDSDTVSSDGIKDDISLFYPLKTSDRTIESLELNHDQQISTLQNDYIKQIQNHLFLLIKSVPWNEMNTEINEKFIVNIATCINDQSNKFADELNDRSTYREQLKTSLKIKQTDDDNTNRSIFAQTLIDSSSDDRIQQKTKQLSYFAIQSLTSILLILIKSAEKNDRTIVHQILTLAGELCEQLPMKCLSSSNTLLFKSLEPLTTYIDELSSSTDPIIAKQTTRIQLSFAVAKGSFKDLLVLLNQLIFNTTEIFNVQGLIVQMNHNLIETINRYDQTMIGDSDKEPTKFISLDYLKSIDVFPTTHLIKLNEELFTGEFISSILLSHIDLENEINSSTHQSHFKSIACEFHPTTFKSLFHIIEQIKSSANNNVLSQILTICLKLFTTHLQTMHDVLLHLNLTDYATDDELKKWFELLFTLVCNESSPLIAQEASKALVAVLNLQSSKSIANKLTVIHSHIVENKYPILIEQFLIELNKAETLISWIDSLHNENDKLITVKILYSFIDLYFHTELEYKSQIETMLVAFQYLILSLFINNNENKVFPIKQFKISSFIIEYLTYIFKNCIKRQSPMNNLFNSILLGLCFMTATERFSYDEIQSIFIAVLPLLAEYHLQNLPNEENVFISCLIGRMCHALIIGLPEDPLELKHMNKFKLPIFAGGYILDQNDELFNSNLARYSQFQLTNDPIDEKEFLMSIYKNIDLGAQLILKLKSFSKNKHRTLPKSIEQQANEACAAIFAVYIKHYRRINLAKSEVLKTDANKPSDYLLSLYEYANRVQTLFSTIKGQGGDCEELYQQIQRRTLFLLLSVRESDLIPIVKDDGRLVIVTNQPKKGFDFQRQRSRWSKAQTILKLLKHLLQACIRFKKFLLEKKQATEEKYDYESIFNRTLDHFIYGDFYKSSMSTTNEEKQVEIDELDKCLHRQQTRAIIRLMTYRFIQTFIQKLKDNNENLERISIYLPYLRKADVDWSYFDHIEGSNNQLKKGISSTYYSINKFLLPLSLQSNNLAQNLFYLLSLSYESIDLLHQMIELLFISFIRLSQSSEHHVSLQLRFIGFNWFRLYVFKLCENIEMEKLRKISNQLSHQQQRFVFNTLIFNEIKSAEENLSTDSEVEKKNSLKDISMSWLLQANESIKFNELYINQYLVLLLRSIRFYKNVLSICTTDDYLQELLHLYQHYPSNITRLLVIKLFRYIIPYILDNVDGISRKLIEKFLFDTLNTIGESNTSPEILTELISLYRTIMSVDSFWQITATELVFNSINSHLNLQSIEANDSNQMNQLLASLSILGGYIEPYRVGSLVKIESNDEQVLALIIEIDETEKPFTIQYFQTNEIESVSIDKLRLEIDVLPPNVNDSILDTLGNFIQIETSKTNTLMFLQLKRRSISVLFHLLNNKKLIEIFMEKPYASVLAKLCLSNSSEKTRQQLKDLRVFNQRHLEQYYLSLERCEVIEDKDVVQSLLPTSDADICNTKTISRDQLIVDALAIPINGWKPYASRSEIEFFKKGRIGIEEVVVVPMPRDIVDLKIIEECGIKHKFRGRIAPNYETTRVSFPTFILDNIQLTEGKWYYCVRLPLAGVIQIGWATDGFTPAAGAGVGDDKYSWSYDGSRAVFFWEEGSYGQFDNLRWTENDVCGCGIEIDGKNTNIKYWLNGKLLGTAFAHDSKIPSTETKCNLLPNGASTTYYPSVTIQWTGDPVKYCELIFSPEDMQDCPLPEGYKPLLLPKLVQTENSIVDYPCHAYLIGDNEEDFFLRTQMNSSINSLRDFVQEQHLQTIFSVEDHRLILPEKSDGLFLSLDNDNTSSLTISFDFQILSIDNQSDFSLIKFNSTEISWTKTNEKQQCAIVFLAKEQQIKVYINNQCQTFDHHELIKNSTIHILPGLSARLQNLALWNYALPDEQISRLFTYGLFYIANDYQQLKEYRKRVNTISFTQNQEQFLNELLVPFNEPFTEASWEKKKKQADKDESKYFRSHTDHSTIDLFGNETYLVLNKSNENWSNYTIVLDILIPQWPKTNEIIKLIAGGSQDGLFINHDGKLCLVQDKSSSTIIPNEYFRLFISNHGNLLQIYVNKKLEINLTATTEDQFHFKSNRIFLFRITDPAQNTTDENTLRVSCKSIMYLNRSISIDQLESPQLIVPPLEMIAPNLIAMGYKQHWIQSVLEQNQTNDIPTILREKKESFIKTDLDNERARYRKIFSKLNPSIKSEVLDELLLSSKLDTNEQIIDFAQDILPYLIASQPSDSSLDKSPLEVNWFSQTVQDLSIPSNITEWIRDETSKTDDTDTIYQLLDLSQLTKKKTIKSVDYSHKNLSTKQLLESRIACEYGLMMIHARSLILNMLEVWSSDSSTKFPLEKFGDYSLLKFLDQSGFEKIDQIYLLIKSILQIEMKELLENIHSNLWQSKTPLFNYLRKEIITQSIQFLVKPSLINRNIDEELIIDEQQPNFGFVLKVLQLFVELVSEKSGSKQEQIDLLIPFLFPTSLINLIFDLFLLIPIHQSKISILHLFTTLTRTSDTFLLNKQIQQFFFQLLIELSTSNANSMSECARKKLQVALTDLIFILLTKANNPLEDYRSKLPDTIQNLFIIIDIIDAWTDPNKQKSLPEKFFQQFNEHNLNDEDFKQSNAHFNTSADQELINLMNTTSFDDLIVTLPNSSEPNPIFYQIYITLSNIPANLIQIRAKFIYLLNKHLENNHSTVDFSLPLNRSFLTDQIRTIKFYLLSSMKFQLFNESLEKTETSCNNDWFSIDFDTVKASTDAENSTNTMFYQAYQQLHANAHTIFRQSNEQLWRAQYLGMHSTDQGGPYRDSITRICSDICSTRLPLFILCPNGRTNVGLNRDCWIPNVFPPNKSLPNKLQKQYRFVGQLMGMAIRKKHYLDLKFSQLFWKRLLQESITIEDIEAIDIQSFTIINEMEKNIEQIKSIEVDNDIESLFSSIMSDLRFDVAGSSGQTYELVPGGTDISITAANFKHYCSCYRQYRLNEFNRQTDLIRQGLYTIIPSYYFSLLTANELEEAVCGKDRIDVELLKRNTSYGGDYNQNSSVIERFWTVLNEMFTNEQKKLFLIFVWGRSTLPSRDDDFQSKFSICSFDVYENNADQTLPRSHTCFFTIDLPAYSTNEIMYERLNYAITYCSSIDGDGNMNNISTLESLESDDDSEEL